MTARRRCARARDEGLTLSELVVTMMIGTVVLGLVASLTVALLRGSSENLARQSQVDEARAAVSWLARTLGQAVSPRDLSPQMGGPVFEEASASRLVFHAHVDDPAGPGRTQTGPSRVTFEVDGDGELHRRTQRPDGGSTLTEWTYGCSATVCPDLHEDLVVARGVDAQLFRYVAADGHALLPPGSGTGLTPGALGDVAAVEVAVVVRGDAAQQPTGATTVLRRISLHDWSTF